MESNSSRPVSPEVLDALRDASGEGDVMTLETFIRTALYHPEIGYYMKNRLRIGRSPDTDFYTASSIASVFSNLVVDAVRHLLDAPTGEYVFVEAGPETESGILGNRPDCPFSGIQLIRPGEPVCIPQKAVVFSNELFDAQPFRRFVHARGKWREMGVMISGASLQWIEMDLPEPPPELPRSAPEGYLVDWPGKAHELLHSIAAQHWSGLFIAFDYGLDSPTLFRERPQGTGRTYSNHQIGSDLLDRPGDIDITCHVIWDIMEAVLRSNRFENIQLLRQEAFFMRCAQSEIQRIISANASGFSVEKQSLMELIHPASMGHQFQVLSASRREN